MPNTPLRPLQTITLAGALMAAAIVAPTQADDTPPTAPPTAPVHVQELTDEYTLTTQNPDGTYTTQIDRVAQRVQRDGTWIPVDTSLEPHADGRLHTTATPTQMSFSNGGNNLLATSEVDGHRIDLQMPFPLPKPEPSGDTLTYKDVLPDVDLVVTVEPDTFSEVLVVHTPQAATNPALASIDLTVTTTNLDLDFNADGSGQAVDEHGTTVFHTSTPMMWDASSGPDAAAPIAVDAHPRTTTRALSAASAPEQRTNTQQLSILPNSAALTGDDVQYPVYIDPAVSATRNTFVVVRERHGTYSNNTDILRVGYCGYAECNGYYRARSYFNFNISALSPRGGHKPRILKSSLYLTQAHSAGGHSTPVVLAQSGTISTSMTWPGPTGTTIDTKSNTAGVFNIVFNNANLKNYVASKVNNLANTSDKTIGFALKAQNENDKYQWKKFNNNPRLEITYSYPTSTPATPTLISGTSCNGTLYSPTDRPVVQASAINNNLGGTRVMVYFYLYRPDGTYVTSWRGEAASGRPVRWTMNQTAQGSYYVTARAAAITPDGTQFFSPMSGKLHFTIATQTPNAPQVTSFTHPDHATYSDNGRGKFHFHPGKNTDNVLGYWYTWGSTTAVTPPTEMFGCNVPASVHGDKSGWIRATNDGTASIEIRKNAWNTTNTVQTQTLAVRALGINGQPSNTTVYKFQQSPTKPDSIAVTTIEAEALPITSTGNTHTINNNAAASDNKLVTVNAIPSGTTTFTFQLPTPTGTGSWQIQPTITAQEGQTIQFAVNGQTLLAGKHIDLADLEGVPIPATFTGKGHNTPLSIALEPNVCQEAPIILPDPAQPQTLTLTTTTPTTYTIDQIRLVWLSSVAMQPTPCTE